MQQRKITLSAEIAVLEQQVDRSFNAEQLRADATSEYNDTLSEIKEKLAAAVAEADAVYAAKKKDLLTNKTTYEQQARAYLDARISEVTTLATAQRTVLGQLASKKAELQAILDAEAAEAARVAEEARLRKLEEARIAAEKAAVEAAARKEAERLARIAAEEEAARQAAAAAKLASSKLRIKF